MGAGFIGMELAPVRGGGAYNAFLFLTAAGAALFVSRWLYATYLQLKAIRAPEGLEAEDPAPGKKNGKAGAGGG